jgi:hypothetical protein
LSRRILQRAIAVDIQLTTEYETVEEFVLDAVERALRPIENRRLGAPRDVLELEALWRSAKEPGQSEFDD